MENRQAKIARERVGDGLSLRRKVWQATPCAFAIGLILLSIGGCSADWYRYSADRQVQKLVRQREEQTLGYKPQVVATTTVPQTPTKAAYAKIPLTPKPPPSTSPIKPAPEVKLPYGAPGPKQLLPSGAVGAPEDTRARKLLEQGRLGLQLGPPVPGNEALKLGLFDSIAYGVQHSPDYRSQMEDIYLAALDVTLQRHLFEPQFNAQTGLHITGDHDSAQYQSALTVANSVGVKQQLPYGGQVTANALVKFVNALDQNASNSEPASLTLEASIPLLQGAGLVNLEPLISSERQMVYQVRDFESYRRGFAVSVASQYFDLLTLQASIINRRENLESLRALTQRSYELYAAGRLIYLDVQRSLQDALTAENDLVDAEARYQTALDNFKLLLGAPVEQPVEIVSRELDVTVPAMSADEAVQLAQHYRLDLRTSQDQVEDAQRGVAVAKNGLLPKLNVDATGNIGNRSDAPVVSINQDTSSYSAGVTLDLPVDQLPARNDYRRSLITLERAQRSFAHLKDEVAAAARDDLRSIRSAQITLQIQTKGIELAKLRLDNAYAFLRAGRLGSRDVTDAQSSLLAAQDAYQQAKSNLQTQVLQFLKDTGTLRVDPGSGILGRAMSRKIEVTANGLPGSAIVRKGAAPQPSLAAGSGSKQSLTQ